jgi:diphosphomevalonate decarboxylase
MKSFAVMPSNIALIKYMGKSDGNFPVNPSLSYTTPRFESYVEIEERSQGEDIWEELSQDQVDQLFQSKILKHDFLSRTVLSLNKQETEKFMKFFVALKGLYKESRSFTVRSFNAFPSSCGLASSASSFAALTMAAHRAFTGEEKPSDLERLSKLSQKGSGSSCRSFFSPWAIWENKGAKKAALNIELNHYVIVVEAEKKKVSSSEAHLRVLTSENFAGRPERASHRLDRLMQTIENDWPRAFEICWNEFWDMHSLFETALPPFGYMKPSSLAALEILRKYWDEEGDGPLVTMDAGANIHLLFRQDAEQVEEDVLKKLSGYRVL